MTSRTTHEKGGVAQLPTTHVGRTILRIRVRVLRRRLDASLADDCDPWSSAALVTRAAQISASSHRRRVAAALEALVELAEYRRKPSPYLTVRSSAVLEAREAIVALAERLRDTAPVDVRVVARLSALVWDDMSPAFGGGRPVETLAETLELCSPALAD